MLSNCTYFLIDFRHWHQQLNTRDPLSTENVLEINENSLTLKGQLYITSKHYDNEHYVIRIQMIDCLSVNEKRFVNTVYTVYTLLNHTL